MTARRAWKPHSIPPAARYTVEALPEWKAADW
jgi:hypothetical protein